MAFINIILLIPENFSLENNLFIVHSRNLKNQQRTYAVSYTQNTVWSPHLLGPPILNLDSSYNQASFSS